MEIKDSDKGIGNFNYQPDRQNASSSRSRNARRSSTGNVRSKSTVETLRRNKYMLVNDHVIYDQIKKLGLTAQFDYALNKYDPHWLDSCTTDGIISQLTTNDEATDETKSDISTDNKSKDESCSVTYNSDSLNEQLFHRNSDGLVVKPSERVLVPNANSENFIHTVDFRPVLLECQCKHDDKTEELKGAENKLKQNNGDTLLEYSSDVRRYFPSHADHFFRSKDDLCKNFSCIVCLLESYYNILKLSSSADCLHELQKSITIFRDAPNKEGLLDKEDSKGSQKVEEKQARNGKCEDQWQSPIKKRKSGASGVRKNSEKGERSGMFFKEHSDSDDSELEQDFEMFRSFDKSTEGGWMSTRTPVTKRENNFFMPASF